MADVDDAAARRDGDRGHHHQVVQGGRRHGRPRRAAVRGVDRQGRLRGALAGRRRAHRDPGPGGRHRRRRGQAGRHRRRRGSPNGDAAPAAARRTRPHAGAAARTGRPPASPAPRRAPAPPPPRRGRRPRPAPGTRPAAGRPPPSDRAAPAERRSRAGLGPVAGGAPPARARTASTPRPCTAPGSAAGSPGPTSRPSSAARPRPGRRGRRRLPVAEHPVERRTAPSAGRRPGRADRPARSRPGAGRDRPARPRPTRSIPFTNIRRRTAEHMVRSKATSAHTLVVKEIDYEQVEQVRRAHGDRVPGRGGLQPHLPAVRRPGRRRGARGVPAPQRVGRATTR